MFLAACDVIDSLTSAGRLAAICCLKYHNLHAHPGEYHHRVYDPATGKQILYEPLLRYQFPTFPEVLDELEYLAQSL